MKLDQYLGVFGASGPIIGGQFDDRRQQQFRVVEHLARHADAGQQAHGLDLIAMLQKIGAHQRLGRIQIAVQE